MRLATSSSTGRYFNCVQCNKEDFILDPKAQSIEKDYYTCSSECNETFYDELGKELDAHDEYCDLCNPNIERNNKDEHKRNQ